MFVCPECGYRDLPCWKAHRYFLYVVYCRIDELDEFKPNLAKRLRVEKDLQSGPYTYHLTSSDYVLRVATELKDFLYKRNIIERYLAAEDQSQTHISKWTETEKVIAKPM